MAKKVKVEMWQTKDGQLFKSREEAAHAELESALREHAAEYVYSGMCRLDAEEAVVQAIRDWEAKKAKSE